MKALGLMLYPEGSWRNIAIALIDTISANKLRKLVLTADFVTDYISKGDNRWSVTKVGKTSSQQHSVKRVALRNSPLTAPRKNGKGAAAMNALMLTRTAFLCELCLLVACGCEATVVSSASRKEKSNVHSLHDAARCKSNSECPSGRRCPLSNRREAAQCSDPETAELGSSGHFGLFPTTGGVHAIAAD